MSQDAKVCGAGSSSQDSPESHLKSWSWHEKWVTQNHNIFHLLRVVLSQVFILFFLTLSGDLICTYLNEFPLKCCLCSSPDFKSVWWERVGADNYDLNTSQVNEVISLWHLLLKHPTGAQCSQVLPTSARACKGKAQKPSAEAQHRSSETILLLDLPGWVRTGDKASNSSSLTGREGWGPEVLSSAGPWAMSSVHPKCLLGGGCFPKFSRLFSAFVGIETSLPINLQQNIQIQKYSTNKWFFLSFFENEESKMWTWVVLILEYFRFSADCCQAV